MELSDLRYFLAVAREESIKIASENLYISQPGLSKVIKRLEDELGKPLFNRTNRKITLTEDGMLLRKRASEIIDLADKTKAEFEQDSGDIAGDIYIGGGETKGMKFIAENIKKFQEIHPNIHYHLFSGNSDDVTERLDKGLLDFGLLIEPVDIKKYDYIKIPYKNIWGILMRKDSPLAKLEYIEPKDIKDLPLLFSRQSLIRKQLADWINTDIDKLNIVTTYNLIFNAAIFVNEGIGYAMCIDHLIDTSLSSNLCFKPLKPTLTSDIYMVWKKYQVFSKATQKFLDELQKKINIEKIAK